MSTAADSEAPAPSASRSRKPKSPPATPASPSSTDQISSSASELPSPARLTYVARKRMRVQGKWLQPGDVVPEANDWPRVESMVRAGFLNEEHR